jgi:hypothetical protein
MSELSVADNIADFTEPLRISAALLVVSIRAILPLFRNAILPIQTENHFTQLP